MSILNRFEFFQSPVECVDDAVVGKLQWCANEKAWSGAYNGLQFSIDYKRRPQPDPELIRYASELLGDRDLLLSTLEESKRNMMAEYPGNDAEIVPLTFETFHLYRNKDRCGAFVTLVPVDLRCWRVEYLEREFKGLGFDS